MPKSAITTLALSHDKVKKPRATLASSSAGDDKKVKRKTRRFRPGTVANREIRRYQHGAKATEFLIPEAPVYRLVKEIMTECGDFRIEALAVEVLRVALEDEALKMMFTANRMAQHANRKTIMPTDMRAARDVRVLHPGTAEMSRGATVFFPTLPYQYKSPPKAITQEPEESSRVTEVFSCCDEERHTLP